MGRILRPHAIKKTPMVQSRTARIKTFYCSFFDFVHYLLLQLKNSIHEDNLRKEREYCQSRQASIPCS
ncbi:MAG: hypothetical protein WBW56_12265, partial [Syntrophobacteraceae bacterium]